MPLALKPQKRISEIDFDAVKVLQEALGCDQLIAQILYNRGFNTPEAAQEFLYPDEKCMLDPFSVKNMKKLVERIEYAKAQNKRITVYGDYDVDGVCATAILVTALKEYGVNALYYIPDRHKEGYGLNDEAVESIFASGTDILITVDCGIASQELVRKHSLLNREIIVTDHHSIGKSIPECLVVKPGQPGDEYENPELCGAGIAFKIAQAILGEKAEKLIDYACVATIADVVPLKKENRYIVKKGLEAINKNTRDCFKALLYDAEYTGEVNSRTVGFTIAPRLNAAGRMESAEIALKLLLASGDEAVEIAKTLGEYNKRRQDAEKRILEEAEAEIIKNGYIRKHKVLVIAGKDWDDGVIGICAARLTEKYRRPTLMFTYDDSGIAKGSARSVEDIDLFLMLSAAEDILIQFGGHKMAAGMSVKIKDIQRLRERLDEHLISTYDLKLLYPVALYDAKAQLSEIDIEFCKRLEMFEPCGADNPEVTLRIDNATAQSIKKIGTLKNHLRFLLQDDSGRQNAVAFNYEKHNCDYFNLSSGTAIVRAEINSWQGNESVSLKVSDFKEKESIHPRYNAELLTAIFYSRLNLQKTGKARVEFIEDPEDLHYMISEWDSDDIAGTLILCDHPEYSAGCVGVLKNEAPRFDVSYTKPINAACGYNALVVGMDIEKTDFTAYKRVVFYDMLNTGYADLIYERASWLEMYALKCDLSLFDTLFEEYKRLSRNEIIQAYREITRKAGKYTDKEEFLRLVCDGNSLNMPLVAVALHVFGELEFITVQEEECFKVAVNRDAQKRNLEESKFYNKILKCINRNIV